MQAAVEEEWPLAQNQTLMIRVKGGVFFKKEIPETLGQSLAA
jgi:hypothetical protein